MATADASSSPQMSDESNQTGDVQAGRLLELLLQPLITSTSTPSTSTSTSTPHLHT